MGIPLRLRATRSISKVKKFLDLTKFIRLTKNRPCIDCGESYPYYQMDLVHVAGHKLFNISQEMRRLWSRDPQLLKDEVAKCVVCCALCSRARAHHGK